MRNHSSLICFTLSLGVDCSSGRSPLCISALGIPSTLAFVIWHFQFVISSSFFGVFVKCGRLTWCEFMEIWHEWHHYVVLWMLYLLIYLVICFLYKTLLLTILQSYSPFSCLILLKQWSRWLWGRPESWKRKVQWGIWRNKYHQQWKMHYQDS